MRRIRYHVEARFDVLEIVDYYEEREGPELADEFTSELETFIERIAERPLSYRESEIGIRRANLDRFPHHVLFEIVDDETIKIVAVKHNRRRPSLGLDR
ncbi:MAG TPA: type II toxin-antitoxin system RelE/ParE family toxin [Pyrinomonadaceae bacterium]